MKKRYQKFSSIILALTLLFAFPINANAQDVDTWETKAPMSAPIVGFSAQVVDGKIYKLGGTQGSDRSVAVSEYDPETNNCTVKASMSIARENFQSAVIDGKIYVFGGSGKGGPVTNTVEEYDLQTNKWTIKTPMNITRSMFQSEVINGNIYVFGGYIGGSITNTVEVYDPQTNKWTMKAPMSYKRNSFQTEVINGKVYAIGGDDEQKKYNTVEVYDPITNTWTPLASLNVGRYSFQAEVINGKIYVFGGDNSDNTTVRTSVEEYDPQTNKWTLKAPMSTDRYSFQTEALNGKIYAIGGRIPAINSMEEYDPKTDKWTAKPSMSNNRSDFYTTIINGSIYAIGGCSPNVVEVYKPVDPAVTLDINAVDKAKVNDSITVDVVIHNAKSIYAEDIKISYDSNLLEYIGTVNADGMKVYKENEISLGLNRYITASLGKDNGANGDKVILKLKFKAKKVGLAKVDIIKGRIADNVALEMDVEEQNCGEKSILIEAVKDVNRSGEFTLLDLAIDAYYYGNAASATDTTKHDADVVEDGTIDDSDLSKIVEYILQNDNYPANK